MKALSVVQIENQGGSPEILSTGRDAASQEGEDWSPSAGSRTSPRAPRDAGKSHSVKKRQGRESRASVRHTAAWSRGWLPATRLLFRKEEDLEKQKIMQCTAE